MKNDPDPDHECSKVDPRHQRGFGSMLVVMLGFTFFSASMWAGGKLGVGLKSYELLGAIMIGNIILGTYASCLSIIASRTGLSTHLLARYSFGKRGSYLPSFLLGITQVGWFGVGVAMFAIPLQKLTGWNIYALIAGGGIAMTATAWFGIRALALLSLIAVPLITILGCRSVAIAFADFGGILAWSKIVPSEPMSLVTAVGICVASFISGGTLTPDFVRFSKSTRVAVSTTLIAFLLGNSLMFLFGAIGAVFYQEADISEVLLKQGMLLWAMLVLGLNIWTTNDNALYASGLGFSNITGFKKRHLVLFNGLIGTVMALYLYDHFIGWLNFLNTMIPSIGGIIIVDYFLVRRDTYAVFKESHFDSVRPSALAAWAISVVAAKFIPGIVAINSICCAAVVYVLINQLTKPSPMIPEENSL